MSKTYWVALARGADFKQLKELGFEVFYPVLDDYVMLEARDDNNKILSRQEELRVRFLKGAGNQKIMTVSEAEYLKLRESTKTGLEIGAQIVVVEGVYASMQGKILGIENDQYVCEVYGYKRVFEVTLTHTQIAKG